MSILPKDAYNPWSSSTSAGDTYYDKLTGQVLMHDGTTFRYVDPPTPTPEALAAMDEYNRQKELLDAEHKEKLEALKTVFPRGYSNIDGFTNMVDIARADQLNPLYEKVLKEFEDAQTALHRAANKLASAVKLTDSERLEELSKKESLNNLYGYNAGLNSSAGYVSLNPSTYSTLMSAGLGSATLTTGTPIPGPVGMTGAPGAMGPQGPKGDKGDCGLPGRDGKDGRDGASYESFVTKALRWYRAHKAAK